MNLKNEINFDSNYDEIKCPKFQKGKLICQCCGKEFEYCGPWPFVGCPTCSKCFGLNQGSLWELEDAKKWTVN